VPVWLQKVLAIKGAQATSFNGLHFLKQLFQALSNFTFNLERLSNQLGRIIL
jgi:hypothetical protein